MYVFYRDYQKSKKSQQIQKKNIPSVCKYLQITKEKVNSLSFFLIGKLHKELIHKRRKN